MNKVFNIQILYIQYTVYIFIYKGDQRHKLLVKTILFIQSSLYLLDTKN